jgi:hypothetical protein
MSDKITEELVERLLGYQVASLKKLDYIAFLLEKTLMHLVELNAAMRRLNQVSGTTPATSDKEMEAEIAIHEEFERKYRDRLSKPALTKSDGGDRNE